MHAFCDPTSTKTSCWPGRRWAALTPPPPSPTLSHQSTDSFPPHNTWQSCLMCLRCRYVVTEDKCKAVCCFVWLSIFNEDERVDQSCCNNLVIYLQLDPQTNKLISSTIRLLWLGYLYGERNTACSYFIFRIKLRLREKYVNAVQSVLCNSNLFKLQSTEKLCSLKVMFLFFFKCKK